MSVITSAAFGRDFTPCPVCGGDCHESLRDVIPLEVQMQPSTEPERMYRVLEPVMDGHVQVYGKGADIPMAEAVRRGLPGAAKQALGRKPTHSPEDRALHPEFDR